MHYVESSADGEQWARRWDRHPNDHDTRVHFHQPPDGDQVADLALPSLHPLEVYSTVPAALARRLEMVHDGVNRPVHPTPRRGRTRS